MQLQISIEARPSRDSFPRVVVNLPKNSRLGWNANGTPFFSPMPVTADTMGKSIATRNRWSRCIVILSNPGRLGVRLAWSRLVPPIQPGESRGEKRSQECCCSRWFRSGRALSSGPCTVLPPAGIIVKDNGISWRDSAGDDRWRLADITYTLLPVTDNGW